MGVAAPVNQAVADGAGPGFLGYFTQCILYPLDNVFLCGGLLHKSIDLEDVTDQVS